MEDWQRALAEDADRAWDRFLSRYRKLIFATIRRFSTDYDDVMDIFAFVCEALRADDLARLRLFDESRSAARVSTWLVAVVRNLCVDWYRRRDGRKRLNAAVEQLSERHQHIYRFVFLESNPHAEAFERLRTADNTVTFGTFVAELREVYRAVAKRGAEQITRMLFGPVPPQDLDVPPGEYSDDRRHVIKELLANLSGEDRTAVLLFVVEEVPADEVARLLGWANRKTVYNRVSRALASLRAALEARGVQRGDL